MTEDNILTIFTPTYNRENYLPVLYESLLNQTDLDFEWLVVDDGSTDHTRRLIEKWKAENKIQITYIYQENQGKPAAHNTAVMHASTELFCICDSDDWMTKNAVERLKCVWNEACEISDRGGHHIHQKDSCRQASDQCCFSGIVAEMFLENSTHKDLHLPKDCAFGKLFELMRPQVFDTVNIWRTDVLRENLFPRYSSEKFVPEFAIWTQIDMKYDVYIMSEVVEEGKYLEDGLSRGEGGIWRKNPMGYAFLFYTEYRYEKKAKHYVNALIHLGKCRAMSWKAANKELVKKCGVIDRVLSFPVTVIARAKYGK